MASTRPQTMTVLFTDVVGSTAWRSAVGADVADTVTAEFERSSRRVVEAAGGVVVKGVGDGVMATFESATAALEAASALRDLARRVTIGGAAGGLRIGVSSGDLVREGDDWLGAAAIEASRLCADADGGGVLVADTTAALIRGRHRAQLRDLGRRDLRGFDEPIGVYALIDTTLSDPDLPRALARAGESPLVGRRDEQRRLRDEIDAVGRGASSTALIVGEPGIGKSRLAAAVATDAARQGFEVLYGRCDEGLGAPYQPVVEAFGRWFETKGATAVDAVANRPALVALWPELDPSGAAAADALAGDPQAQRWRLFESIGSIVRTIVAETPLLIVVDDLHWADPSTRALLGHLTRLDIAGLFLLATVRSPSPSGDPIELLGEPGSGRPVHVMRLDGLPAADIAALLASHAHGEPPDALVRRLHQDTAGNPFFIRTLLRHLDDVAHVRDSAEGWITPANLDAVGVPDGVRAVVHRRLATVDDATRRALEVGAVCGSTFDGRTVSAVIDVDHDMFGVLDVLDPAVTAGLIREDDPGRYSFVHALVRQTLRDDLTRTAAARMHWRIAEALEQQPGASLAAIAAHYNAGRAVGSPEPVLHSAHAAGDEAMQRLAFDEADAHFRVALSALDELAPDPDLRYRLLVSLGTALNARAIHEVGDEIWLEAARVAKQAGDPARLHTAILGYQYLIRLRPPDELSELIDALVDLVGPDDSPRRATALGMRAMAWIGGDLVHATRGDAALADEAVAIARRVGDPSALAHSLRTRLNLGESSGTDAESLLRDAEEIVALFDEHGSALGLDTAAECRDVARALIRCGRAPEVDEHLRLNRERSAATGERLAMNAGMVIEAALATARGRFAEGKRLAAEAFAVSGTDGGLEFLRYSAHIVATDMEQGRIANVASALEQLDSLDLDVPEWQAMRATALADCERRNESAAILADIDLEMVFHSPRFAKPLAVRHLAEACRLLADRRSAETLLPYLEPWAGQMLLVSPGSSIEGASDRSIGHVLAVLGRDDEAVDAYTRAIEMERASQFPPLVARSSYWLARTLIERSRPGDGARARQLVAEVQQIAGDLGMQRLHEQAVQLAN